MDAFVGSAALFAGDLREASMKLLEFGVLLEHLYNEPFEKRWE